LLLGVGRGDRGGVVIGVAQRRAIVGEIVRAREANPVSLLPNWRRDRGRQGEGGR
jgi:hypothetical protein